MAEKKTTELTQEQKDLQQLQALQKEKKEMMQEDVAFDETEFLKLEVGQEITCFCEGIKTLPNKLAKGEHDKTKDYAILNILGEDENKQQTLKKFLVNAVMPVTYCKKYFESHPDEKRFALKIDVVGEQTNKNGKFLDCKFYIPAL